MRADNGCKAFPTEIRGNFRESKTESTLGKLCSSRIIQKL